MSNDETTRTYLNFRYANDSPAALLRAQAADLYQAANEAERDDEPARAATYRLRANGYSMAATFLMAQEVQTDVTFVALDNDTLDAVISNYEHGDLYDAMGDVADLLGLED